MNKNNGLIQDSSQHLNINGVFWEKCSGWFQRIIRYYKFVESEENVFVQHYTKKLACLNDYQS